jgi:hypothetical protein
MGSPQRLVPTGTIGHVRLEHCYVKRTRRPATGGRAAAWGRGGQAHQDGGLPRQRRTRRRRRALAPRRTHHTCRFPRSVGRTPKSPTETLAPSRAPFHRRRHRRRPQRVVPPIQCPVRRPRMSSPKRRRRRSPRRHVRPATRATDRTRQAQARAPKRVPIKRRPPVAQREAPRWLKKRAPCWRRLRSDCGNCGVRVRGALWVPPSDVLCCVASFHRPRLRTKRHCERPR